MGVMEIVLIVVGGIILVLSFVLPVNKKESAAGQLSKMDEGLIKDIVEKEIKDARVHINGVVDETITYSMEKTERAMERLTNEKIMMVNEYSEQVLGSINKSHQEVMFLYDMLNDKHEKLISTVSEASKKAQEIKQTVQDAEITVQEASGFCAEEEPVEKSDRVNAAESTAVNKTESTAVNKTENKAENKTDSAAVITAESKDSAYNISDNAAEEDTFLPIAPEKIEVINGVIQGSSGDFYSADVCSDAKGNDSGAGTVAEEIKSCNNNDKILRLHRLGKSKTAIAKELSLGVGEVKLVIDLFEQVKV